MAGISGLYRQSERGEIYAGYVDQLLGLATRFDVSAQKTD